MADKIQFNLYIDRDLVKAIKRSAIEADKRPSDHVADIIAAHLDRQRRVAEQVELMMAKKHGDDGAA